MIECSDVAALSSGETIASAGVVGSVPSSAELDQVRLIATLLRCNRGKPIYSEGEEARFVYLLDEGIIPISGPAESGQRQILAFRVPGDLFGFPADGRYANTA